MIHTVSLDSDGGVRVHEGRFLEQDEVPETGAIARVPAGAMVALDLFNEGRQGFDWDRDAGRVTELLIWALEDLRLDPQDFDELERKMQTLCQPGGPTGGPFTIDLVSY